MNMKSMEQMQREMLAKCEGKEWPKPVARSFGVLQLVYNQEDLDKALKGVEFEMKVFAIGICGVLVFCVWMLSN